MGGTPFKFRGKKKYRTNSRDLVTLAMMTVMRFTIN